MLNKPKNHKLSGNKIILCVLMFSMLSATVINVPADQPTIQGESAIETNDNGEVFWLEGNIDSDPLFVDPDEGYFSLQPNSPCIDAGTAFFEWEGDTLINLTPDKYFGDAPDMGAIEYIGLPGDLNDDLFIDILDAVMMVFIIIGEIDPTLYQLWAGELNGDGIIDILDIVLLIDLILDT